jgi:hypothetical protein
MPTELDNSKSGLSNSVGIDNLENQVLCITFFLLLLYSFFALIISCAKSMLIGRNFVVLCYLMQFSQDKNGNLILFLKTPSSLYALMHLDIFV